MTYWIVATLLLLHGADGRDTWVAPDQITSLRGPGAERLGHYPEHAKCLVGLTDGKFIVTLETCDQIKEMVEKTR